jgi:glycosyltransferase involved in cell wall biosynthesis
MFFIFFSHITCLMELLKISVVVPTYKRPALLLRCLDALLSQSIGDASFEIIVISDGDDPATSRAIEAMPVRKFPGLKYYSLPSKSGPAAARNVGWMLADAELVAFTDDDCIPASNWLASMWTAYRKNQKNEIAFSGNTVVPINSHPTDYEKNISQLAAAEFITANCACTKDALQRVGGFDERFRMAWREDSDLQFKFIQQGISIIKVADALVTHPVRKAPWGVSIKEERKGMFNALLYKKYPRLYRQKIEPTPPWHYYAITFFLVMMISGMISDKTVPRAIGMSGWLVMTAWFAGSRLRSTSHSWNHVSEVILTSAIIPVLSLFWKFYGSWKFKALLIP